MRSRSAQTGLGLAAAAGLLFAVTGPAVAAGSATTPDGLPPRISAVLDPQAGCAKPSKDGVTVASAAQKILMPSQAWQLSRGKGVTVALLDTGLSKGALPQLDGQVTPGEDIVRGGRTRKDCIGHGTFVAGLIAARPKRGTTVVGIAPQAHVYSITVTDDNGATSPDVLAKGINAAVAAKARIIDVSVVSARSNAKLKAAVKNAIAHEAMVFAPAAADDQNIDGPVYPASLPGVISVANSTTQAASDSGSSTTPMVDAVLAAPGDVVLSVGPGGGAFVGSGTAYATALVAGSAALMDAYHPGLTLAQRTRRLITTAYPASPGDPVVDPYAALAQILPGEGKTAAPPKVPTTQVDPLPAPDIDPVWYPSLTMAAIAAIAALAALGAVITVTRGRARGWRPKAAQRPVP